MMCNPPATPLRCMPADLYLADYLHRQHTLAQARANKQNRLEARSQRNLWTLRKEPSTWENTPVRLRLPSKNEVSFGPLRMQLRQHARVEELLQGHPGGKATAPRRLTRYLPRVAHLASCLCYWSERGKVSWRQWGEGNGAAGARGY